MCIGVPIKYDSVLYSNNPMNVFDSLEHNNAYVHDFGNWSVF